MHPCALTIAGSDSGGGAGIQADLKTFAAHGVHGLSALAALTAQHTRGVTAVHVPPVGFLREQIDACFDDFDVRVVKLGMLADASVIAAVADAIERHRPAAVVLDPVMVATSGARLLDPAALDSMRARLVPLATLVTPNVPEAELLLGRSIRSHDDAAAACEDLLRMGASGALLKGGHLPVDGPVVDRLHVSGARHAFEHRRLQVSAHGTGCTLASAVAARLALGDHMDAACLAATGYVHRALLRGYRPGKGDVVVLDHFGAVG